MYKLGIKKWLKPKNRVISCEKNETGDFKNYFDTLNDDSLHHILEFSGKATYAVFGSIDKRCNEIFDRFTIPKQTFYGFVPTSHLKTIYIEDKSAHRQSEISRLSRALALGAIRYNTNTDLLNNLTPKIVDKKLFIGDVCEIAAADGEIDILDKVFHKATRSTRKYLAGNKNITSSAAEAGQLDALKLLLTKYGFSYGAETLNSAARGGHVEIVKYLNDCGCNLTSITFASAALGGNIDVLEWLIKKFCPRNGDSCNYAARAGQLEALEFLRECGFPFSDLTFGAAARGGHLAVLKYLKKNGCPWSSSTACAAALGGDINILKWLIVENNCPVDENCCSFAARAGNIETLIWLRQNGHPWGEKTCNAAVQYGQLETLKWLRKNNCPINDETYFIAARTGSFEIVRWLNANERFKNTNQIYTKN